MILEDGYKTQPVEVGFETSQGKGAWVRVIMGEGRKRQIRETCSQLGLPVVRIIRIRIGTLRLGKRKPRQWRHLYADEVDALKGRETKPNAKEIWCKKVKPPHRRFDFLTLLLLAGAEPLQEPEALILLDVPELLHGTARNFSIVSPE